MTVLSPNSEEIGVFDKKTATVLTLLKKVSGTIRFSLFLGNEEDVKRYDSEEKRTKAVLPLEINIYGPLQNLEEIGKVLSDAGMFLQEPIFLGQGIVYRNPHFLSWGEETTTPLLARPEELPESKFRNRIEEVMSSSVALLHPPMFIQDRRITTPLKRFGLNMMVKRVADMIKLFQTSNIRSTIHDGSRRPVRE